MIDFDLSDEDRALRVRAAPAGKASWPIDRYELGERIGQGGAAEVFRARDRQLGREVAVKILHESLGSSSTLGASGSSYSAISRSASSKA